MITSNLKGYDSLIPVTGFYLDSLLNRFRVFNSYLRFSVEVSRSILNKLNHLYLENSMS